MREQLRALPSNEGKSPLPEGLEMSDVYRAFERELDLEEGITAKFYKDNDLSLPMGRYSPLALGALSDVVITDTTTATPSVHNHLSNGKPQGGMSKGTQGRQRK